MDKLFSCAVLDEIQATQNTIKSCYSKIAELEDKLNNREIADEIKHVAILELKEVKKLLATNERQLSQMHRKNSKSFAYVAIAIFLTFLVYGIYAMFFMKV